MSSFKAHLINKKYRIAIIVALVLVLALVLALVLVGFLANDVFQQASDDTANQPTSAALPTLNNTTSIALKEPDIGQLKPLVKEAKSEIFKENMGCKNQWGAFDMLNFLIKPSVPMDSDQYGHLLPNNQ